MSTIRVDNLQPSDGLTPAYDTSGVAKVWLQGSIAAVPVGSTNVTSGTDVGTGDYDYTFTNNMDDALYGLSGLLNSGAIRLISAAPTSSSVASVGVVNVSGTREDREHSATIDGALA